MQISLKYLLTYKHSSVTEHTHSMRTCMNILTSIWPKTSVARATRHSRSGRGCAFSLMLTGLYADQKPESNLNSQEEGR